VFAGAVGLTTWLQHTPSASTGAADPGAEDATPPTVIFVVLDTLRADHTSLCGYGRSTTNSLEMLVRAGATYTCNAHTPSTWTLPTHAAFFTGEPAEIHRVGGGGGSVDLGFGPVTPLGPELKTLAERFTARGYQTLFLSANPAVAAFTGLARGFEHTEVAEDFGGFFGKQLGWAMRRLLDRVKPDPARPAFIFVNIADPHAPWEAVPDGIPGIPARTGLKAEPGRTRFESGQLDPAEADQYLAHLTDVYDYSVMQADESLGVVFDMLRSAGLLKRGFRLVVTSDHGEHLGEHGRLGHGGTRHGEPLTRVPVVYMSTAGKLPLPEHMPASATHSLVLDGKLPAPMPPQQSSVFLRPGAKPEGSPCTHATAAVWEGGRKWVAAKGKVERFDLAHDAAEDAPTVVSAESDPVAKRLLSRCELLDAAYTSRSSEASSATDLVNAQLQRLGYMGGTGDAGK